jgi:DNA-binding NtrC family response regulator
MPSALSILFVDDEPNTVLAYLRVLRLRQPNWSVFVSTNAEQALQVLHRESIDVVVSDMLMGGMNGPRFLALVKERYPRTALVALSGMLDPIQFLGPASRVTKHYLCKPTSPEKLRRTIAEAAREHGQDPGLSE